MALGGVGVIMKGGGWRKWVHHHHHYHHGGSDPEQSRKITSCIPFKFNTMITIY